MDRLRDRPASPDDRQGDIEAEAAGLMRAIAPYSPPPGRKERVRRAVAQRARAGSRRAGRVRPVLVVSSALVITAIAGVSLGRTWVRDFYQRIMQANETTEDSARRRPGSSEQPSGQPATPAAPVTEPPAAAVQVPAPLPTSRPAQAPSPAVQRATPTWSKALPTAESARGQQPSRAGASVLVPGGHATDAPRRRIAQEPAIHRASSSEDAGLVVAAMQALRSDADPVKAGALLDEYLRLHPQGILAEEALVLAIESAQARSDARCAALAQQYLRTYPKGAYATTARRALERR